MHCNSTPHTRRAWIDLLKQRTSERKIASNCRFDDNYRRIPFDSKKLLEEEWSRKHFGSIKQQAIANSGRRTARKLLSALLEIVWVVLLAYESQQFTLWITTVIKNLLAILFV
jgi:hypothetical protein